MAKLANHPRLYIPQRALRTLKDKPATELLQIAADRVAAMAEDFVKSPVFEWKQNTHNAHLIRARHMQTRVVTLIARYYQTGDDRYRDAAIEHLLEIGNWEYWSWITWRQDNADPNAIFDLSYGENCATLAVGYDLLRDELTDEQQQAVVDVARRGADSFIEHTRDRTAWWFGKATSNWNTVCAGGGGMLALAMHEHLPKADMMLRRAEESVKPFMDEIKRTKGGWVEGIGYWNYGMRYAFMYLLSHQRATGKKHTLLNRRDTQRTLQFPVDFSPHGHGCSFGDVNHWAPLPFHFAACKAVGEDALIDTLNDRLMQQLKRQDSHHWKKEGWPNSAELLLLHPDNGAASSAGRKPKTPKKTTTKQAADKPVARVYAGLDWAVLADSERAPTLYASIRAGSSEVPHAHLDLSSFHLVANGEHFIQNLGPKGYLDSTFSPRRWELFEMAPCSKNVLLLNGVGFQKPAEAPIEQFSLTGVDGFRIKMTEAMGGTRDGAAARFYGRVFLKVDNKAIVVLDRVVPRAVALLEQRMFTTATVAAKKSGATLTLNKQKLGVAYAADIETRLVQAQAMMTHGPEDPPTALRHCSVEQVPEAFMATVFTPGDPSPKLTIDSSGRGVAVTIDSKEVKRTIRLTNKLLPGRR